MLQRSEYIVDHKEEAKEGKKSGDQDGQKEAGRSRDGRKAEYEQENHKMRNAEKLPTRK